MESNCLSTVSLSESGEEKKILLELEKQFLFEYGFSYSYIVKAPGRVNIIGEHIDYCGYPVFPMALKQGIYIAVAPLTDGMLTLKNYDKEYESFSCKINEFEIDSNNPDWYKYILCGIKGMQQFANLKDNLSGFSFLIYGNIPPAAGLSSSSALVCATILAVAYGLKLLLTRKELAEIAAKSERYIGTEGGGMDQAVSFLATTGSASLIEFDPLLCTPVKIPYGLKFFIANSLVEKNKAASSDFNCRVVECRIATHILAKCIGLNWLTYQNLAKLQLALNKSFPEMIDLANQHLHPLSYSKKEICTILDVTEEILNKNVLTKNTHALQHFQLHDRCLHVLSEAERVWKFKDLCDSWSSLECHASDSYSEMHDEIINKLGKLMYESHNSTKYLYCCSHPNLDTLVTLSKDIALGARLTGAGWGGCIVAMVEDEKVSHYEQLVKEEFYLQMLEAKDISDISVLFFMTYPGSGACVFQ